MPRAGRLAITNAWIAKYEKDSGRRVAEWKGKELLVLRPPTASAVLELDAVVPFESEGQGITIDGKTGLLWSIQRRTGRAPE